MKNNNERIETLFSAMENHGDAEGTETQLGDAEEFLRLAIEYMPEETKSQFLTSPEVTEFIEREGRSYRSKNRGIKCTKMPNLIYGAGGTSHGA